MKTLRTLVLTLTLILYGLLQVAYGAASPHLDATYMDYVFTLSNAQGDFMSGMDYIVASNYYVSQEERDYPNGEMHHWVDVWNANGSLFNETYYLNEVQQYQYWTNAPVCNFPNFEALQGSRQECGVYRGSTTRHQAYVTGDATHQYDLKIHVTAEYCTVNNCVEEWVTASVSDLRVNGSAVDANGDYTFTKYGDGSKTDVTITVNGHSFCSYTVSVVSCTLH